MLTAKQFIFFISYKLQIYFLIVNTQAWLLCKILILF